MGQLYDAVTAIQKAIDSQKLDSVKVRGAIGLKSGVLLALVKPDTPDDPAKLTKLRDAAKEILGVTI